jgi:hypothetical protein
VISDPNFCRQLALKYARRAVYSKDGPTRKAFADKARALAELAVVIQASGPVLLKTAGELP